MTLEKIEYGDWGNCLRLSAGKTELVVTLDVGPRVIRFGFVDGQNMFREFTEQRGESGDGEWHIYGGHRFWHAPEVSPRTYCPDNKPVEYEWDGRVLKLRPPEEQVNGIQKEIEIVMDEKCGQVEIMHRLRNTNPWAIELAPWCLSVMAPGGRAVVPHEEYRAHTECLLPSRPLVLWHFTKMNDPRWTWGENYFQLRQDDSFATKQKIGALNTKGWAAYVLNDDVFIKRFGFVPGAAYPDFGCNCEFYTEPGFLEVESLGPLSSIPAGGGIEHQERWGLYNASVGESEDSIEEELLPLVEQVSPVGH